MARHFDRHISMRITTLLLKTPLTPNHVTFISCAIGIAGALQFLRATYAAAVSGAVVLWLHSVLDGCDGEMARLTSRESRWGAIFDYWGDNIVHVILFSSIAIGLYGKVPGALWLGGSAALGSLGAAWLSYKHGLLPCISAIRRPTPARHGPPVETPGTLQGKLRRLEILLAQRDFIYLLLLCALLDLMHWFLWAAGIGAPIYLAIIVYLKRWTPSELSPADTAEVPANYKTGNYNREITI